MGSQLYRMKGRGSRDGGDATGALGAREGRLLTWLSWLQGVPGNNGLPGQPGLTAELVGAGQDSLCSPLPRKEPARPAP